MFSGFPAWFYRLTSTSVSRGIVAVTAGEVMVVRIYCREEKKVYLVNLNSQSSAVLLDYMVTKRRNNIYKFIFNFIHL